MTRDEIKNTPELVDFLLDESVIADSRKKLHERMDKICNLAIKALEQQPCEDAINRQELLDAFWKLDIELRPNAIDVILKMINDISPVTPQQKIGQWITTRTFMHDGEFYCNKCKCDSPNNEKWDYCPNCGAKMVKPQESEG